MQPQLARGYLLLGEMNIAQYFSKLSSLWQELDYYQDFQASCTVEKERVYDFLAGLNDIFDQIRVQVLR